jgi:hypothetical protein
MSLYMYFSHAGYSFQQDELNVHKSELFVLERDTIRKVIHMSQQTTKYDESNYFHVQLKRVGIQVE